LDEFDAPVIAIAGGGLRAKKFKKELDDFLAASARRVEAHLVDDAPGRVYAASKRGEQELKGRSLETYRCVCCYLFFNFNFYFGGCAFWILFLARLMRSVALCTARLVQDPLLEYAQWGGGAFAEILKLKLHPLQSIVRASPPPSFHSRPLRFGRMSLRARSRAPSLRRWGGLG
jgi:hypothetical protein